MGRGQWGEGSGEGAEQDSTTEEEVMKSQEGEDDGREGPHSY